jgi:hypothetical protein
MTAPTFAEYDRHLAEFEAGRKVWLATAAAEHDPIARELALKIASRISDYDKTVRAFLTHARAEKIPLRAVDVRRKS